MKAYSLYGKYILKAYYMIGSIILVEKIQNNYICEDDIYLQICRTFWIQDRTGRIQDRMDAGQDGCRTGWMHDRTDVETGQRSDAGQIRYKTGRMEDRADGG